MEPWYKVTTPRAEVREGRSFNPDEFAIALEQVVAGSAPLDYRDPAKFFARTCFTRALREHAGMVLRRLSGFTENTAPVLTLITQFGGGKTHTLTALYHLLRHGKKAASFDGVDGLLREAGLTDVPDARVAVFVGNAWDPKPGRETPWLDIAFQLAEDAGVAALGTSARTTPPGTTAIGDLVKVAGGKVLVLFDEVLNFVNRHRSMADGFYALIQNLTVAMTGTTHCAAVISLPRSQVEMTDHDMLWQERITRVVRRVAKDLIANDETEISEVIRRRLFDDIGKSTIRKSVAKAFADWCFERRAQLPPEWTAVDSAATEAKARDYLRARFEASYPFHPATLTVFQRKWQVLPQYQQTRGTLAMLAQWVSWAARESFRMARTEPLITLGSAPLDVADFRAVVLGQLSEPRLAAALDADLASEHSHARALDAGADGRLKDIHRRVGTAILFESSGGMAHDRRVAHLPELRFALGEPGIDTTSIDNAAIALELRGFFLRKVGTDGYRFGFQPTLKKVVSDRRASLDDDEDVRKPTKTIVRKEFERGATLPLRFFPEDSSAVDDSPRLTLVVLDPETEWNHASPLEQKLAEWTLRRGEAQRLYPASLIWCVKKPGRALREKVELWQAWKKVEQEISSGVLAGEFEAADRARVSASAKEAEDAAKDEVWADYRFIFVADTQQKSGLRQIDLGAGHSSGPETLCGRVITALRAEGLLSESVGAGYLDRKWPEALKESGAWSLLGLRQSILNGSLTRLIDPDSTLRKKIIEFVEGGDLGLASGQRPDGTYQRVWFKEPLPPDEISFDAQMFLLTKDRAQALKLGAVTPPAPGPSEPKPTGVGVGPIPSPPEGPAGRPVAPETPAKVSVLRVTGNVPPELWNRLGNRILPKLRQGQNVKLGVEFTVEVATADAARLQEELRQALRDLGLEGQLRIETPSRPDS